MSLDQQREFWNGPAARGWVTMQERLTAVFAPVTAALVAAAAPAPGEHVLDIGCGSGDTTLAFAGHLGGTGSAEGVDISAPLLALARRRAQAAASPATFVEADAATLAPGLRRDLLVSRFGVMFFDDPAAAFANLRAHVRPGGRLAFACWQAPGANPWITLAMRALETLLPPVPVLDPHAPGPFAFADFDRVRSLLSAAGWHDIAAEPLAFSLGVGEGADPLASAVDFLLNLGPAAQLLREASDEVASAARTALAAALAPHASADGIRLPAAIWFVTARA